MTVPFLSYVTFCSSLKRAVIVCLLSLLGLPALSLDCVAQAPVDERVNDRTGTGMGNDNKLLNRTNERFKRYSTKNLYNVRVRKLVGLDRIFEFDRTPLGDRIPIVIVPGRAEEFQPNSWWKKLEHDALKQKNFRKDFKLYVYIYDSRLPLKAQAEHFNRDMKHLFGKLPKRQKSILVTYSLGGMITVEAMRDMAILNQVHTVFAIAVPFHGSPMFDPSWFSTYLNPPNHSPLRRFGDRVLYRAYLFDKTNLIEGLRWDNYDGSMPQFDAERVASKKEMTVVGPSRSVEDQYTKALKKKTVIYASFLKNEYSAPYLPKARNHSLPVRFALGAARIPGDALGVILPFYSNVHSVFPYMGLQLANIPTFTPEEPQGKNTHLYRYNDGVIPMGSMLWLPSRAKPYSEDLQGQLDAVDVANVRIFPNLDHMHIGDYDSFRPKRVIAADVVHPDEGRRKPRQWLLYDIAKLKPILQAIQDEKLPVTTPTPKDKDLQVTPPSELPPTESPVNPS